MKIQHIRNATIILEWGAQRVLVDPMLVNKGALPSLKLFAGRQKNPTVELPASTAEMLESVTHCLITHCQKGHFDHLDRAAIRWLNERQLPVICTPHDSRYLAARGLNVQPLPSSDDRPTAFFEGQVRTVRCTHGEGMIGRFMEHGVGYLIELPGQPSVYLAGDTLLTAAIREFVLLHQPQVSVVPAGGACFELGSELIMGRDEVIEFAQLCHGAVVANHLEAINHCPVTREELARAAIHSGVNHRLFIPADGQTLMFG